MAEPKKPEGQYLLVNQSRGLSNQLEAEDELATATLNVNITYSPGSLAANGMDLEREKLANRLPVLPPTVPITAHATSVAKPPLHINLLLEFNVISADPPPPHRHTAAWRFL